MAVTWTDVILVDDPLSDDVVLGTSKGQKIFECIADGPAAPEEALAANDGTTKIPTPGDAWSALRPYCTARSRSCKRRTPAKFTVTVNFEDPTIGAQQPSDFLNLPAVIHVLPSRQYEEYNIDRSNPPKPVRTTAGEPFTRFPTRLLDLKVYQVQKYVNLATKQAIENAEHTTNSSPLMLDGRQWDVDQLLMVGASFDPIITTGQTQVWLASMEIHATTRDGGWVDKVLNYGTVQLVNDPGDISKHLEAIPQLDTYRRKQPYLSGWPLDANGVAMDDPTADPLVLTFRGEYQNGWVGVPLQ